MTRSQRQLPWHPEAAGLPWWVFLILKSMVIYCTHIQRNPQNSPYISMIKSKHVNSKDIGVVLWTFLGAPYFVLLKIPQETCWSA